MSLELWDSTILLCPEGASHSEDDPAMRLAWGVEKHRRLTELNLRGTVRARPGQLSGLSVSRSKSVCVAF